ncbi:MAG: SurA N-terminal domain-containing protein [Candidatus Omnitrophica bacterium]|nr:SurA N-terminal domain-containing protein [Candidatus Omnitrophota bacterium]
MKRIIWGLAILIIPAFVIWGAGSTDKKRGKGPDCAGKIFDKKISFDEYADMWRVTRDQVIRSFGNDAPPEFIDQMAWNRLLLLEAAKREKITASDTEIAERIISSPAFQRDGKFDKKLYKSMLGQAAHSWESKLRDDILISKLREKATFSVSVTDEEVKKEYRKKFEKIKASYISILSSEFEKDVRYQESDLIKFYRENKASFIRPDEVDIKYIEILFSQFDKEIYVDEEAIKRYFEEHISDYKKPDSEEMPVLDEAIKKSISEKLSMEKKISLAEELSYKALDNLLDKKDMEKTAKAFALEAKETGFFNMQQEVPGIGWSYEFTKKSFELDDGEISNVLIKTDKGFYMIQLKERKASYMPEFSETRDSVITSYTKNKSIELSEKEAKKIHARIKNGQTFESIGKEIKETALITRNDYIPALGPAKDFVEACASLKIGEIADPIKMPETWAIPRLDEYQDMDDVKFIEEKESFAEELLAKKKQDSFNKYFEELKKKADFVSYTSQ